MNESSRCGVCNYALALLRIECVGGWFCSLEGRASMSEFNRV